MPNHEERTTENDLVEALVAAMSRAPLRASGYLTRRELDRMLGWHPHKTRAALHQLVEMGMLKYRKIEIRRMLGPGMMSVPAYKLQEPDKNEEEGL